MSMKTMLYLAMTAQELSQYRNPVRTAYMACHFSPYGPGITNVPESLPEGAMVILNDRIPFLHHDCALIAAQLASLPCDAVLLDLENTDSGKAEELIAAVLSAVQVPVGVSEKYASGHSCAEFISPSDADEDPFELLKNRKGREIWLDLSPGRVCCRVTSQGCERTGGPHPCDSQVQKDDALFCHYSIAVKESEALFYLHRTWEDICAIMEQGKAMGVTRGIGLYQEWKPFLPDPGNK